MTGRTAGRDAGPGSAPSGSAPSGSAPSGSAPSGSAPRPGAVHVVSTSRHAPPGQLTLAAWDVLRSADVVLAPRGHPHVAALRASGVDVREVDGDPAAGPAGPGTVAVLTLPGQQDLPPGVDVVVGSSDPPGSRLLDAVAVMDRLRSPGGCPWDAAQTHASLLPYLLEEAYEACEAIEDGDGPALREELGDVLLQVLFHARLAQEGPEPWSVDDVAGGLVDKLVRRHPHVFAGADAGDLEGSWEALKAVEKGRTSVTEGVPLGQPALSLAGKLQRRARRLGAPVPAYDGAGGALWELVRRCGEDGTDPEAALRAVARRFRDELASAERALRAAGTEPAAASGQDWQGAWNGPTTGTS